MSDATMKIKFDASEVEKGASSIRRTLGDVKTMTGKVLTAMDALSLSAKAYGIELKGISTTSLRASTNFKKTTTSLEALNKAMGEQVAGGKGVQNILSRMSTDFKNLTESMKHQQKSLNEITKGLKTTTTHLKGLKTANESAASSLQKATKKIEDRSKALEKSNKNLKEETKGLIKATQETKKFGNANKNLSKDLAASSMLMKAMAGYLTVGALKTVATELKGYSDGYMRLTNNIRVTAASEEELIRTRQRLFEISQETRTSLATSTTLYNRLSISQKELGISTIEIEGLIRNVSMALAVTSTSALESRGSLLQLSQAFGNGIVRAEEFNSIMEGTPRIAKAAADGLGITRAALRKLVLDGQLTSKMLFDSISSQTALLEAEFSGVGVSIGQAQTVLQNALTMLIGDLGDVTGVAAGAAGGILGIADALKTLRDPLLFVADAATTFFTIFSSPLSGFIDQSKMATDAMEAMRAVAEKPLDWDSMLAGDQIMVFLSNWGTNIIAMTKFIGEAFGRAVAYIKDSILELGKFAAAEFAELSNVIITAINPFSSRDEMDKALRGFTKVVDGYKANSKTIWDTYEKGINKSLDDMYSGMRKITQVGLSDFEKAEKAKINLLLARKKTLEAANKAAAVVPGVKTLTPKQLAAAARKAANEQAKVLKYIQKATLDDTAFKIAQERVKGAETLALAKAHGLNILEVKKAIVANISEIQQDAAVKDLEAFKKGQKKIISEIKKMNKDVEKERKKVAKVLKYIAGDGKDDDSQVAIAKIEGAETLALAKELGMNLVDVAQATQDKITDIREKSITEIIESYTPPSFGNELADSIMSAVSAMDSLNTVYEEHAKKTVKIQALRDRADATEDLKERERLMGKVADGEATLIKEQLSGYRELFSTTKTMFKENSKARKAMNTMEMAFAAAEIGMNLQKSISNAVVAITTQGSGDPYTAFFRVAAMAASMASILSQIGGSVSGGSGSDTPRKAAPAIGTVFGDKDAVSESILNSEELLDSYHAEDYAELTGIHREVRDLNNNITGIVRSLIRGDGGGWTAEAMGINEDYQEGGVASAITKSMDVVQSLMDPLSGWVDDLLGGIVSKAADWIFGGGKKVTIKGVGLTQARDEEGEVAAPVSIKDIQEGQLIDIVKYVDKKIKKSGMFGTSSSERETDYEDVGSEIDIMFTKIFKNLGNSFMEIADIFNMDAKLIEDYVIDIGKIDLQNLETGDEINEALQAGLANISDTAATELFGDLVGRYQDIGEGVFETAVRVASQQVIVLESLKKMDGAFDDLGLTERSIEFTQGLIEMSGGMDSFMQSVETYYSKFFSDAERLEDLKRNFSAQFADLGIAMPGSRVDFRSLGDKAMNTQNEEAISTFLRLVPLADEYYTLLEKEESKRAANAKKFGEEISDNAAAILNFLAPFEKMTKQADMSDVGKAYDNLTEKYEKANLQLIALGGATSDNIQILTDAQGIEMDTLKASVIDPLKEMVGVAEDAEGWEKKLFEAKWDTIKADMELLDVWDEVLFNKAKQIDMEKELGQASMNTVEIINQAVGKLNASTAEADKDLKRLLVGGTDASFALTELIDFATAVGDTTNISAEDIAKALGLLDDAYSTAIQGAISAAQDMSNAFYDAIDAQESLTKTIEDTIFNLKYSEINQALTSTKFETAKGDYTALKEAAMGGSSEDITKYLDFIDTYLNLARETEKSSEAYQTEYDRVMRDLGEGGLLGYTSGEDFLAKEEAKNIAEINRKTGDLSPSAQTFLINATTKIKRDFQPYFDASNDVLVDLETTLGLLIDAIDDLAALSFIPSASGGKDLGDRPKPAPYVPKDLGDRPRPTAPGAMSAGAILQAALTQTQGNFASNMKDANVTADEIIRAVQGGGYADISEEDIREYLATGGFRNGGWSDGPDSGYLVGLHGKEYVMNESEYKEIANMVSRAMNYSQGSPRESSGSSEETKELIKEQNRLLEDQNEMMLSLLEKEQTVMVDGEVLGSIVDKRTQRTFEQYDRGAQSL